MSYDPYFLLFGSLGLAFRVWVSEVKLAKQLGEKNRYFSRLWSLYFMVDIAIGFKSETLYMVIVGALPLLYFCALADLEIITKFLRKPKEKRLNTFWVICDELTLHLPMVITGTLWWIYDPKISGPNLGLIQYIIGFFLIYIPLFGWDPRWKNRTMPGKLIVFFTTVSFIGAFIYWQLWNPVIYFSL